MAGTEGTVEFEMIDIVEERASDREKDVLKQKLFFITSRKEIMPRHRAKPMNNEQNVNSLTLLVRKLCTIAHSNFTSV